MSKVRNGAAISPPKLVEGLPTVGAEEPACLVRCLTGGGREIIAEGSLQQVAALARSLHIDSWRNLVISFPERRIPPFRYEEGELDRVLIGSRLLKPA